MPVMHTMSISKSQKIWRFRNRGDSADEVVFKCYHLRNRRLGPGLDVKVQATKTQEKQGCWFFVPTSTDHTSLRECSQSKYCEERWQIYV